MVLLYRSLSATLYHLLNWQTTDSVWFMTHCIWLVTVFLHETKIRYAFSMCFYRLIFLPTTVLGLASTDWITCCHLPQEKKKTWLQASLLYAYLHIQFRNTALDRRIWSNTLCFLWLVYYRGQTYISLYSSLWPGDHGYGCIPPQKEIKYSHFENCSTNAFPKISVIALVLPSYLGIYSPFLIFPFALFQHLPNHSFFIWCLRGSALRNVESHNWLSFKWRKSAWDLTDYQEETLFFSGAMWVKCKLNKKE